MDVENFNEPFVNLFKPRAVETHPSDCVGFVWHTVLDTHVIHRRDLIRLAYIQANSFAPFLRPGFHSKHSIQTVSSTQFMAIIIYFPKLLKQHFHAFVNVLLRLRRHTEWKTGEWIEPWAVFIHALNLTHLWYLPNFTVQ